MPGRKNSPVFVIGCHRSGTNLLYDTLLSAGGFAVYRASSTVYSTLIPRFGDLAIPKNRERLMQVWLQSKSFRRSGLRPEFVRSSILKGCRSGGDFLRIIMEEVARHQDVERWAVYDPDNALYIREIKRDFPDALLLHIIRDGRDISLSLTKMGGLSPFWWDRKKNLFATALYWQWVVRKARQDGRLFLSDYCEVHYEDLVTQPQSTLSMIAEFLDHDLDYDRIQRAGIGSVCEPNSTFPEEIEAPAFNPINRWMERLSQQDISQLEGLIGECLQEFGYCLLNSHDGFQRHLRLRLMDVLYPSYFDTKLWLKSHTPLGRLASLDAMDLAEATR
ncbi:MAG: sulfotransferase [Candidatus Sulfotelmatobacter sp.]